MSSVAEQLDLQNGTRSHRGEPTWELAFLYPQQGTWTVDEYLRLDAKRSVEFVDGYLEFLPMPTDWHQAIATCLWLMLYQYVQPAGLGRVRVGALPMRTIEDHYREPDVLFMLRQNEHRCHDTYWEGADIAMEIISPGKENRDRDAIKKRREYAEARIPEYWIIDREQERITVLTLRDDEYVEHGVFGRGMVASSVVLPGFMASVDAVLDAK